MSNEELKPCPFCGGAAGESDRFVTNTAGKEVRYAQIYCENCFATVESINGDEKEAIAVWNRRVTQ